MLATCTLIWTFKEMIINMLDWTVKSDRAKTISGCIGLTYLPTFNTHGTGLVFLFLLSHAATRPATKVS